MGAEEFAHALRDAAAIVAAADVEATNQRERIGAEDLARALRAAAVVVAPTLKPTVSTKT